MISFACRNCGKTLGVKDEFAGKAGKCPHCREPVQVPGQGGGGKVGQSAGPVRVTGAPEAAATIAPQAGQGVGGDTRIENVPGGVPSDMYGFLAPAQAADEIGRLGPYRVLKVLGAGGMGVVFQAEDPILERKVALKAMLPNQAADESGRKRFIREAKTAASIEHDNIVRIYQVGEDRGVPYIAMEFLKGEALDQRIKRGQILTLKQVVRIGKEAALGLAAAHKHGLVHRDIKPANLWLEADTDRVKVLDFGLARAASGDNANITQSGAIIGTPAYMAPEQANGKKVDGRTDLFSLGCVLYQMCTGQQPFRGTDTVSTLVEVATHDPKAPAEIDPTVPRPLSRLIMKLLAKAPADRASSTAEVAEVLGEMETSQEITDEPRSRNRAFPKADLAPTGTLLESPKQPSKSLRDSITDADENADVGEAARKPRKKADTFPMEVARPSRRKKRQEAASNPMLLWGIIGGGVALVLVVGLVIGAIVLANSGKGSSSSSTSVAQGSPSQSPGSAGPTNGNSSPPASKSSGPGTPVIPLPHISWDEPVFFLFKGPADPGPADVRLKSFMSLPPLPKEVTFVTAKIGQRVWTDPNKDFALSKLSPELNDTILLWHGVGFCRTWLEGADMTALQDCSVFAVVRIHDGISLKVPKQKLTELAAAGWTETNLVADTTTEHNQIWQWKVLVKTLRKGDSIGNLP